MKSVLKWGAIVSLATTLMAQTVTAPAPADAAKPVTITAADVQSLKDAIAAQQAALAKQQRQLEELSEQLQRQQEALAVRSNAVQTSAPQLSMAAMRTDVAVQQDKGAPGMSLTDAQAGPDKDPMHGPLSIRFKGITITPGGFAEAAFVRRSRALGADLPTPFNSLTMPGAAQSQLSEFFGSARQSRPTMYVDGRMGKVAFSSYLSADFLSSGDTSTNNQTNSYTLRLRQVWGQAKFDNGFSFLGGQAWSLVTENKAGIAPSDDTGRTNDARPATVDPSYNAGFSFARQYGVRVTQTLMDNKVTVAASVEAPQATLSTHGNANNFLLGSEGATNSYNDAVSGCTTSTYTATGATTPTYYTTCSPVGTYSFNPSPDVIAKIAFDPGFGHYEVFGLWDRFRDRVYPCANFVLGTTGPCPNDAAKTGPSAYGATNVSTNGGAFGANARWNFDNKHVVFGLHFMGGRGIGRYGAAGLADLAIRADGAPAAIKNGQGLATLEWHGKKLDVYSYAGAEFNGRTDDYDAATKTYVGYGSPFFNNSGCYSETAPSTGFTSGFNPGSLKSCTADTRALIEGTLGFWYRLYNGPRGKFQYGMQYSYITRQTWSGTSLTPGVGVSPEGIEGQVYTSFRYYLP
jgi:uncharacterized coiled-coil protein SlyX